MYLNKDTHIYNKYTNYDIRALTLFILMKHGSMHITVMIMYCMYEWTVTEKVVGMFQELKERD